MATNMRMERGPRATAWRRTVWGTAACLMLLPIVASRLTREVGWTLSDFVVWGAMLLGACGAFEVATRVARNDTFRLAAGVAVATGFLEVWANLAVGIIGSEQDAANLMFFGVPCVGIAAALLARFRAEGMARALVATAIAQGLAGLAGAIAFSDDVLQTVGITVMFTVPWLVSAALFRKAARQQPAAR